MRAVGILAWKDLRLLVSNPLFCFIALACTCLWSFTYMRNLFEFAQRSMMSGMQMGAEGQLNLQTTVFLSHISYTNLIFIAVIPALTMRLISEEKKTRTYDLLLTAPISATQIAMGKFFAAFGVGALLVAISFLYPLFTFALADFNVAPLLTAYLGLLLVTACYAALGLFASSLTESVVLSVVLGWVFNLTLWFISQGADFSDNQVFASIMEQISFGQHFMAFIKGTVKTSSLIFFVSCVALFVFMTQRVVESSRWR